MIKNKIELHKQITLTELCEQGWEDSTHKYAEYMIMCREDARILYDAENKRIISSYIIIKTNVQKIIGEQND